MKERCHEQALLLLSEGNLTLLDRRAGLRSELRVAEDGDTFSQDLIEYDALAREPNDLAAEFSRARSAPDATRRVFIVLLDQVGGSGGLDLARPFTRASRSNRKSRVVFILLGDQINRKIALEPPPRVLTSQAAGGHEPTSASRKTSIGRRR